MRPDMHHLLVERGHAGRSWSYKRPKGWKARCRYKNEEDADEDTYLEPKRGPMFSENLNPLRRYLEAQVGRPWDKVYSEIRARVNANSAVKFHILQHLFDFVLVDVKQDEAGRSCFLAWHGELERLDLPRRKPLLYVCPRTGLLRRTKVASRRRARSKQVDHIPACGPDHEYRIFAGQWYEVWWNTIEQDGKRIRVSIQKRQLSYKELRKLGLRD